MRLKVSYLTATVVLVLSLPSSSGDPIIDGLSNPLDQPFLEQPVANALDPSFVVDTKQNKCGKNPLVIQVKEDTRTTGLIDNGYVADTRIYGYKTAAAAKATWPGPTISAKSGTPLCVKWENKIAPYQDHIINGLNGISVVDTSIHWAYSLHHYMNYTIFNNGVPIVTHLHGGHSESDSDGNPEHFFTKDYVIKGPLWAKKVYTYENSQPAAMTLYHDHALGITRLNVYAGMAGLYVIRDEKDNGKKENPLKLPAGNRELAFAIQDRQFKNNGELYYPAFDDGHPAYQDLITSEGATLLCTAPPDGPFCNNGGPTVLPEFFGDHFVVNGAIWPKYDIMKADYYRIRLVNGCDSRFLVVNFVAVPAGGKDTNVPNAEIVPYHVVGTDQGLVWEGADIPRNSNPLVPEPLVLGPGNRYDIVIDFAGYNDMRIIMTNEGGDTPFGGLPATDFLYHRMTTIMAFDVAASAEKAKNSKANRAPKWNKINQRGQSLRETYTNVRIRRVALFEGNDEYGRLQPLLGTAEPATDFNGVPINWPDDSADCFNTTGCTPGFCVDNNCNDPADCGNGNPCAGCPYTCAGLSGQIEGTVAWHSPTTENPKLNGEEEWWIINVSADAHPVHLHLVYFEVISRHDIIYDSDEGAAGDGIYVIEQPLVEHNGKLGSGRKIVYPSGSCDLGSCYDPNPANVGNAYVETGPMDVVTALPNQVTKIRAKFDKPGYYVWHCHILSHEDHEMMRVLYVGPGA